VEACLETLIGLAVVALIAMGLPGSKPPEGLRNDEKRISDKIDKISNPFVSVLLHILWWIVRSAFWLFVQRARQGFMASLGGFWVLVCVNPSWLTVLLEFVKPLVVPVLQIIFGEQGLKPTG
jgi:hypothetical protein